MVNLYPFGLRGLLYGLILVQANFVSGDLVLGGFGPDPGSGGRL